MTWRRFLVLLRGLSPNSASVTKLSSQAEFGQGRGRVNKVEGPKAAQAAFESIFGPPPKPAAE